MISDYLKKAKSNEFAIKVLESLFGRGSLIILNLLFSLVCTQLYGVEVFGKYTYGFTLISILMIIAKAGLDNGIMYSIPKSNYKYVSFSFLVNFIISVILVLIGYLFIDNIFIKFMLPLIWFLSAEQIFFGIYRSEGKIKEYFFINGFLSKVLKVGVVLTFYYLLGKNEYSIAIGVYISFIFSIIIYVFKNRTKFKKISFDKSFLMYSFTLVLVNMMGALISKIDIIMLGNMTTNKDVGIYQITVQISSMVSVLLLIFNTVFAPRIAKLYHQNNEERLKGFYIKATRFLAFISLITTFFLIMGSELLLYIFGSEFTEGQTSLIYRSLGQFVNIAVGGVWVMLSMTGKPKFQMYANICALIINIVLNFSLIPKFGIEGAAFASMITIIFTNIVGYVLVSKQFDVKVFKYF